MLSFSMILFFHAGEEIYLIVRRVEKIFSHSRERERECVCKNEYDESSSCSRLFFRAFAKKSCDIWLEAFSRVVRGFVVVVVFFRPFFLYREIDTVELFSTKLF